MERSWSSADPAGARCPGAGCPAREAVPGPDDHGRALAYAAGELARTLLAGTPPWATGRELPLAVVHLRHLVAFVPAADRAAFLFLLWQDRGRLLTPGRRRELAVQADADAEKIVLAAEDLEFTGTVGPAWRWYLGRVTEVAGQDTRRRPRTFLLFEHARLSHRRWGIDPAADALAAMALRLARMRDSATRPEESPRHDR